MCRIKLIYRFFAFVLAGNVLFGSALSGTTLSVNQVQKDPAKENQILYNGKAWRNMFTNVKGDQFLFAKIYLPGSVSMDGKSYNNLNINYDIYNDEIILPKNNGTIIQLNKEMVDSFTLDFNFKTYRFKNTDADSLSGLKGYVNVLYDSRSALYVKYKKEIDLLAVDEKYDLFFQTYKIYIVKDATVHQLSNKSDLLKVFQNEKTKIKAFIKKNGLRVSKKVPESFVPVIRYYDSLSQ
jgi:hypothetical protein